MLAGLDMPEAEGEAAVGGALRERLRGLAVNGVAVGPAGVEDERRSLEILSGVDAKAGGVDQAAARARGSSDGQSCGGRCGGRGRRALAERIREAECDDRRRHKEQQAPDPN